MTYQPFPIADFRTGLFTAREAWLAPTDAFPDLINAKIKRGRIQKREGHQEFGLFPTRIGNITAATAADPVELTSASHGLSDGDFIIVQSVVGMTEINNEFFIVDNSAANTLELKDEDGSGYTAYVSGGTIDQIVGLTYKADVSAIGLDNDGKTPVITTSSAHGLSTGDRVQIRGTSGLPIAGMTEIDKAVSTVDVATTTKFRLVDIDASGYTTYTSGGVILALNNDQITGVAEYYQNESANEVIATNFKRVAKWDSGLENFIAISTADNFTLSSSDKKYFWFANGDGVLWMTDFKDRPHTWDGTTLATQDFDISGSAGGNKLNFCKIIVAYNRRMVMLYTQETVSGTTTHPQRARWSSIDGGTTDTDWDDTVPNKGGSLDAATDEEIISAAFLRDSLIVFFERSIWALKKTFSADIPFRWEKIADSPGIFASTFGTVGHQELIWSFGPGGIVATDGQRQLPFDELIPNFEDEVSDDDLNRVFASKLIDNREIWFSYPKTDGASNDTVKVYNYESKVWSEYDMSYNVMGEFNTRSAGQTWQVTDEKWEDIEETWESFRAQGGFPQAIIGDDFGFFYLVNLGTQDAGRTIPIDIKSARMNPFKDAGRATQLGFIDILFDRNDNETLTIEFFVDWDETPYDTQTIQLDGPNDNIKKIWKRVYVGAIGNTHQFKISQSAGDYELRIHAFVPYFKPVGRYVL